MYGFGAAPVWRLFALALLQGLMSGVCAGGNQTVETVGVIQDVSVQNDYFSPPWLAQYSMASPGCTLGRGRYTWRHCGLGSNINNMLNSWVYFLAVEGWSDLSVIADRREFRKLNCFKESGGVVAQGWGCLFRSMPHMCVFDRTKAWRTHMTSANVSDDDLQTTANLSLGSIRRSERVIDNSLQGLNIDHLGALAVMAKYLWSNMTPWFRNDVDFVTHAKEAVEGSPFLGLHVRRGDKLKREAEAVPVEEYLKAAAVYFEHETTQTGVDGIKAIWVASDDPDIVDEVRNLAPAYFPDVLNETIVYVANGVTGGSNTTGVRTYTAKQDYGSFVYILADLEKLAEAELFVGTFSSNVGRLVVVLREGLGKQRSSSISLDSGSWYPGRQRSLLIE